MQLTIINKITLGFGLFGCLLLLTSILSYFGLSGIKDSALDVVEQKMPVQTSMVKVKTEILSLSVITANGYHVEDIAADRIAHGKSIGLIEHRADADEELRCTGSQRDHRETDHQLRDAEDQGKGHSPLHKQFTPTEEQADPHQHFQGGE